MLKASANIICQSPRGEGFQKDYMKSANMVSQNENFKINVISLDKIRLFK